MGFDCLICCGVFDWKHFMCPQLCASSPFTVFRSSQSTEDPDRASLRHNSVFPGVFPTPVESTNDLLQGLFSRSSTETCTPSNWTLTKKTGCITSGRCTAHFYNHCLFSSNSEKATFLCRGGRKWTYHPLLLVHKLKTIKKYV